MAKAEIIEQLAKRRGFFWISSEIYGGFGGFYEYGHVGTLLKRKLENLWRKYFLSLDENFFEIETSNIMPEKVFVASGHLKNFVDPIAKCKKCGTVHRADHLIEDVLKQAFEGMTPAELEKIIKDNKIRCTKCKGELDETSVLNMMFPVEVGSEKEGKAFLRPETAQGAYVNFLQQFEVSRKKLRLGLAIIGKAFRNEISPRQTLIRTREFTQAELQIFFDPEKLDEHEKWDEVKNYKLVLCPVADRKKESIELTAEEAAKKLKLPKFYVWHMAKVQRFFLEFLNIPKKNFRLRELSEEEKAFYNKIHWDVELKLESLDGWKEIGGVHFRTDHDLSGHEKISGHSQEIFFGEKKFIPNVLELSFGIDRIIYGLLDICYAKEKERAVLKFPVSISPFTVAVFPLVNKDGLDKKAKEIYEMLKADFDIVFDDSGSIGRRYYRQDEIGTKFGITVDYDTIKDDSVTIRNRDDQKQERVKISELAKILRERI